VLVSMEAWKRAFPGFNVNGVYCRERHRDIEVGPLQHSGTPSAKSEVLEHPADNPVDDNVSTLLEYEHDIFVGANQRVSTAQ
jgi:hypothetical protein